jgi:TIR domain/Bacterial SH3 domain
MSSHVFVSHSHEDSAAADSLVKALEERGVPCWVAPRDVPPGGSYAEALLNAIESANCFVLIYSEHSNVSSHVLREVERALKFGLNIVPVRFDESTPSKSLDYLLATVHWLSVTADSRDRSLVKAAEQIAAWVAKFQNAPPIAKPDQVPPSPIPAVPIAPPPKRHFLWVGVAVLLALVAGLIWFFISKNPSRPQSAQKSEVTASAPTAASPSVTAPAQSETDTPVAVAYRYFGLLNKRNATAAYNLLSADFRRRLLIAKYSRTVGTTPPVKVVEATMVSKSERTASVTAVFEDTDPASRQARWQGPIEFVFESAAWRIDSMKGLRPATGRPIQPSANGSEDETMPDLASPTPQSISTPPAIPSIPTPPASTPPPGPVHRAVYGVVHDPDGITNVREQPFLHARIIGVVRNGERVEVDGMQGDWVRIILGPNKAGFIHKSRLKIDPEK